MLLSHPRLGVFIDLSQMVTVAPPPLHPKTINATPLAPPWEGGSTVIFWATSKSLLKHKNFAEFRAEMLQKSSSCGLPPVRGGGRRSDFLSGNFGMGSLLLPLTPKLSLKTGVAPPCQGGPKIPILEVGHIARTSVPRRNANCTSMIVFPTLARTTRN